MNLLPIQQAREQLLTIFSKGLEAVNGQHCVHRFLSQNSLPTNKVWVVAVGKAAGSMMSGAADFFSSLDNDTVQLIAGLVITKRGHGVTFDDDRIECLESDHPFPTQRSLEAGSRLVEFVKQTPKEDTLLFLISGGTSALVEVLPEATSLEQLDKLNHWLLSNPWPIDEINRVRQSVSRIKAGKLLGFIRTPHLMQLTISDVTNNDLSIIGSGLLVPPTTQDSVNSFNLPDWVKQMQGTCSGLSAPPPLEPCVEHRILADNATARSAIEHFASSIGLPVVLNETIAGKVNDASTVIAKTLKEGEAGLYVWGGETVVDLPDSPGRGGRCQTLALLVAEEIEQRNDIVLLAAGTDGTDGPGDVAGALIDGMTTERGRQSGFDSKQELFKANAGQYLEETSDLIDTGPTGTNVMDLVIAIKLEPTII